LGATVARRYASTAGGICIEAVGMSTAKPATSMNRLCFLACDEEKPL
jgi:hypothetical protein